MSAAVYLIVWCCVALPASMFLGFALSELVFWLAGESRNRSREMSRVERREVKLQERE